MTGTQQERTVRTCPPGADSGGWQSVPVEILINLPTPTLWLPVPVPSVPQQGWSSAPHSPALPRVRSCCLRGAASSLSLHSCSLHRVPSSAWLPGHSLAPMAEGVQQPQASHQQSALLQHTCCCVHSQGTVLTWRKWQLPKYSLKKLQDLESTK